MEAPRPLVRIEGLHKDYRGLRPLRIERFTLAAGERVALGGVDAQAAEMLVNLITGASLPDRGEIHVFGRPTAGIADSDDWFRVLDRFGIVSERAVLLEAMSVRQNIAVPFTLDLDPIPDQELVKVARLAGQVGLGESGLDQMVGEATPETRQRIRVARALALDPEVLLLEHPTAGLTPSDGLALASDLVTIGRARGLAILAVTIDRAFSDRFADRRLLLDPATGALHVEGGWKRWLPGWSA